MIGSIKGKIILKTDKFLIVETSGIGYKINVNTSEARPNTPSLASPAEEIFLWIHTHVREDALDLYGFLERIELEFFEMLIGISGIGPRSALAILGIASIETLQKAIATSDTSYLTKISGIGKKTAERIVIELRDKMGKELKGVSLQGELDALEALKSLGYSQNEAREALKKVTLNHSTATGEASNTSTNIKIKEALKILGNK